MHVEIERFLPHGRQKDRVTCLAHVLLRDLKLDRLVRPLERAEEGRRWFAHLEIDRSVLDLDDRVRIELPVERMKIVVRGPRM